MVIIGSNEGDGKAKQETGRNGEEAILAINNQGSENSQKRELFFN